MSRYRSFSGTRGDAGAGALSRAKEALAAGDKLSALRAYSQAFNALWESGSASAPAMKAKAAAAIAALLAELGPAAFGPDLCSHGQSKNLACWCCVAADAAHDAGKPEAPLAKTSPDADLYLDEVFPSRGERRRQEDEIEAERKRRMGGGQ